ncbi:hypothetical protein WJX77_006811 [Trebouxia sp. C0004]
MLSNPESLCAFRFTFREVGTLATAAHIFVCNSHLLELAQPKQLCLTLQKWFCQESLMATADYGATTFAQYTRDIVKDYEEETPKQPQTTLELQLCGPPDTTLVDYLKQQESSFGSTVLGRHLFLQAALQDAAAAKTDMDSSNAPEAALTGLLRAAYVAACLEDEESGMAMTGDTLGLTDEDTLIVWSTSEGSVSWQLTKGALDAASLELEGSTPEIAGAS